MTKLLKVSGRAILLVGMLSSVFGPVASPAYAAPILTVTPLTWNVIGLDSNDETSGPDNFPVAVRVCNESATDDASNVTAEFVWDDGEDLYAGHDYINLRTGSKSSLTHAGVLAAGGACTDFYFEATVTRDPAAYIKTRAYHIEISSDEGAFASSPQPRELYTEYLVSQSRNATTDFALDGEFIPAGGSMGLVVGNEYEIKLYGSTATNGYEQLETFINFPNTIFQILSVSTEYDADSARVPSPNDMLYSDSCLWENDPGDLSYLSCLDVGKNGGDILVTYRIKVIGGAGTTQQLTSLIYDFSGSSFHYNADFSTSARIAHIIDPSTVTISKEFIPDPTSVGGISTLNFIISNPNGVALDQLSFTDTFPTTPGAMLTAAPATYSSSGCGTPTLEAPIGGGSFQADQPSISATNLSVGPNATCTVSVQVTAPVSGTYNNQTTNLLIGGIDTGNYAEDSLTADTTTYPPPLSCAPGTVMAYWDLNSSLLPTYQSSLVSSAAASYSGNLISTVPFTHVAKTGWGLTSDVENWPQVPDPPPGYPLYGASPYFQFSIDSSQFTDVQLVFDVGLDGNWANASDNHIFVWSEADGGGYGITPAFDFTPVAHSPAQWHLGVTADAISTGSATTNFRINEIGAKQTGQDPTVVLDEVYILGCGLPEYPTISKSFAPDPVAVGGTSTLSFTINNPNQFSDLTGISFSDILPDGLTVASAGPVATCGGNLQTTAPDTVEFSGGSLAAGTNCTLSGITVTATTAGPHTNISGFVSSAETGANSGPGGSATATLTAILPPQISKSFSLNPLVLSAAPVVSTLTFSITNPNQDQDLTDVSFADTFPTSPGSMVVASTPNANLDACGSPSFTPAAGAGGVSFSSGTIAAGGTCTVSVDVAVSAAGTYENISGQVADGVAGAGNTAAADLEVLLPQPGISLQKQVSNTASGPWAHSVAVAVGGPVYYRFVIENIGDVSLSPVSVTDDILLAAGLDPASCVWPLSLPAPVAASDAHLATCVLGPISAVAGDVDNTATAQGTYGGIVYYSEPSTARYKTYGLTLDKTADESVYTASGQTLHYNFLVTNSGYVRLADPVTIDDDKASDESCPAVSTVGNGDDWLDPAESITCSATYLVPGPTPPLAVTNTALASADGIDSTPDSVTVTYLTPPTVTKAFVPPTINVGDTSLLIITLNNPGGTDLTGVAFTDTYPAGKIYNADPTNASTDCTGGILTAAAGGGSVALTGATLEAGGACTVSLNISSVTPGDHNNTIPIDGVSTDQLVSNTSAAADTLTVNYIAPTLVKAFTPDTIFSGGTSTLTLVLSNPNNAALTSVAVSDNFPGDVEVAAAPDASSDCGGTFSAAAGASSISLSGGTIAALGSCTLSVDVTADTGGTVTNTTGVVSSEEAPDSATASDDLTVLVPSLALTKTGVLDDTVVLPAGTANAGDTVTYSFSVENTGNVELTSIVVSDPLLGSLSCTIASLAVGATDSCSATGNVYTLTQADIDAGQRANTATASSAEGVNDTDSENIPLAAVPSIDLVKNGTLNDDDGTPGLSAGDTIDYSFVVTNDGNVTLTGVTLADTVGGVSLSGGPIASLAVGAVDSTTFTGSYTVTQADIDAGSFFNTATATGSPPSGPDVSDPDNETVPLAGTPSIALIKSGTLNDDDGTPGLSAGDTIDYTFTVTNDGNLTLTAVTLSDTVGGVSISGGPIASLAVGASDSTTFSGSYTVTQADIDAGSFFNTATATGSPPSGPDVSDPDNETVPLAGTPSIALIKSGTLNDDDGTPGLSAGDTIDYSFTVTNDGNLTLTAVTLSDTVGGVSISGGPIASLAVGASDSTTFSGSYTVTQADIDAGSFFNTATATGSPPSGPDVSDPDNETVILTGTPLLSLLKTGTFNDESSDGLAQVGETISYTFEVTNEGNQTLSSVAVTDPLVGTITCPSGNPAPTLAVGASLTCSGSYTITQADIDAGQVDNTATADSDESGPDTSDETTLLTQDPSLQIVKTGTFNDESGDGFAQPGETISYTFVVTNDGNLALSSVAVTDPLVGTISCPGGNPVPALAVGAAVTCTGSYAVTQVDIDAGQVDNTATADSAESGPDTSDEITILGQNPLLEITKIGTFNDESEDNLAQPGETISYSFRVRNIGNITLSNITVTDPLPGLSPISCPPALLPVGQTMICTATYAVNQADIDAGQVDNTATADSTESGPDSDDESTLLPQDPVLSIIKTGTFNDENGDGYPDVGETISYTFSVSNDGNVTLTNVAVTDPLFTVSGGPITLDVGQTDSTTFSGTYAITQDDINAGLVNNTATATSSESPPDSDSETVDLYPMTLDKLGAFNDESGDGLAQVGETISYTFTVKNEGGHDLHNVTVTDPLSGLSAISCPATTLPAGMTMICSASYAVTQADIDAGLVENTATAASDESGPITADETVNLGQDPLLSIIKTGTLNDDDGTPGVSAGDTIDYQFSVSNDGNVTLTNVTVTDPQVTVSGGPTTLAVGETDTTTFSGSYTITQADIDAGQFVNTATADSDESGPDSDLETTPLAASPSINLTKTGSLNDDDGTPGLSAGDTIDYAFTITNNGNVTLTDVTLADTVGGVSLSGGPIASLAVGASDSTTFTGSYTVTQADLDAGSFFNTATVTGSPPSGADVSDPDDETVTLTPAPSISLVKTGAFNDETGDGFAQLGETISFNFAVTNTGNQTLSNVLVSDPWVFTITCPGGNPIPTLAVGATVTCTGDYNILESDIDAEQVDNTATADSDQTGPVTADETILLNVIVGLNLEKAGVFNDESGDGYAQVGETISYTFTVWNEGAGNLTGVGVLDPMFDPSEIFCPFIPIFGDGAVMFCTATYSVTQADIDAGRVDNTATADSEQTAPVTDDATTLLPQNPLLSIVKSGTFNDESSDGLAQVGETISYEFEVTNAGNLALSNVSVTDPLLGTISCPGGNPVPALAVGSSVTCTGSYAVTQADIDAGGVDNTATADSDESGPDTSDESTPLPQNPLLLIVKSGTFNDESSDGLAQVGETISYQFAVSNGGSVTLTNVAVTDPLLGTITCPGGNPVPALAVGSSVTCTGSYAVTQADIDAGGVDNTATADSDQTGPVSSDETTPLAQNPVLSIIKTGAFNDESGDGAAQPGESISYSFAVSNNGNLTLSNVSVSDPLVGTISCPGGNPLPALAVSATVTCTGNYLITQADIDAGQVDNTATADSNESGPDTSDETTLLAQDPLLALVKTGTFNDESLDGLAQVGETISYQFAVRNVGNITLHNVAVTDALVSPITCPGGNPVPVLAVGGSLTCAGTFVVTQADIDAGRVDNTATADSDESGPDTSDETTLLPRNGSLTVEKSSTTASLSLPGTVTYSYLVTNTGNVTITGLSLSDDNDNDDLVCALSVIPVGSTTTCTATHTFTQAELDAYGSPVPDSGLLSNTVTASSDQSPDATDTLDIPIFRIFDPPSGAKTFDESGLPALRWTMVWINDSNNAAQYAAVYDPIPEGTSYLASGLSSGYPVPMGAPAESTDVGVSCIPDLSGSEPSTTTECYYEGPTPGYPRGRIIWKGTLGPDFGASDQDDANNELVITFNVAVEAGVMTVTNLAVIDADLNDDRDITEEEEFEVVTVQASWTRDLPPAPPTGFEPGVVTAIPAQLESQGYQQLGPVWLEIPALGIKTEIVGVPLQDGAWDVTWLVDQAGWLEGSAFPSYEGNSILTAHVYLPSGYPGPFVNLNQLSWNDEIIVHVYGQKFVYQVRSNQLIQPDDPQAVQHEELPWLTLLTCKGFNPDTGAYDYRVMVKAVLMEVQRENQH